MDISSVHPPLSNVQAELLKVFNINLSDKELVELKDVIARFLLESGQNKADIVWDEKGYTDEKLQQLLNGM